MASTLPIVPSVPHQSFQLDLDGTNYGFEFKWNERAAAWFLNVSTSDWTIVLGGIKVVINFPLLSRYADARLPPGAFFAIDTAGKSMDAGIDDLGDRVQVIYFSESELSA